MNLHDASLEIIRQGQAPTGAYVASPAFSQYGYCWLRDGAWTAYGMDCAGQHDSARAFYRWVGRTLCGQDARLEGLLGALAAGDTPVETDYLPTRFTLDGGLGDDFWWDFQLDGYGAWLWGLAAHLDRAPDAALQAELAPAVDLTVRYLTALWQAPNYDCWEEFRDRVHTSTLAALYGGLRAAQRLYPALVTPDLPGAVRAMIREQCVANGHLVKYVGSEAVDASLLWAAVPFGAVEVTDPLFLSTLAKIERDLHRPGGGVYRYAADTYYGGGEWILLTAWLAWVYLKLGRTDEARPLIAWIEAQAAPGGALPEQVSEHLLDPAHYAEWETKWGRIACPLLWSHGMVLILEAALEGAA